MPSTQLHNTDCNDYKLQTKVDLILLDPPYNIGYKYNTYKDNLSWEEYYSWQVKLLRNYFPYLKPHGNLLYLNYPETAAIIWSRLYQLYHPVKHIQWIYHTHTGGKPLRKGTRTWLWLSKGPNYYCDQKHLYGEYRNPTDKRVKLLMDKGQKPIDFDWWPYEQVKNVSLEKTDHPCQLPLIMIKRLIQSTCPEKGIVFDPFMGSGTTGVACAKTNRDFIGIEKDQTYFNIAQECIRKFIPKQTPFDHPGPGRRKCIACDKYIGVQRKQCPVCYTPQYEETTE